MFSYRTTLVFLLLLSTMTQAKSLVTIPFNLNTIFHAQELPLKKMHALCMEVWGTIDAGLHDPAVEKAFHENHVTLLSRTMLIHSMFDTLIIQISKIMNENPEYYDYVLSEIEHLYEVLQDAHKSYQVVVSQENTYTYAINHVLEILLQKIGFLLQTRLAISPYYAYARSNHPSAMTPLLVPAKIYPLAPII